MIATAEASVRLQTLGRRLAAVTCAALLAAGLLVTSVAVRDALALGARPDHDLGPARTALLVAAAVGGLAQLAAGVQLLRGRAGSWSAARSGFVLLVLLMIAYLAAMPRSDALSVELALAVWAGAFAAATLALARRQPAPTSRAGFWLFQACLALVLAEGTLRTIGRLWPNPLLVTAEGSVLERIEAHSVTPGYVHFGFPTNSQGFYDDEFVPAAQRSAPMVAVIGDSFSLSLVPHRAHYTTVCERELGDTLVYNIGVGACGPEEYRQLLLADALPLEPAAVVVALFAGNDLMDLHLQSTGKGVRSWFDRGSCRLLLVASRVLRIVGERNRGGVQWSKQAHPQLRTDAEIVAAYPWYADPKLDPGTYSAEAYRDTVRSRIPFACRPGPVRLRALFEIVDSMRALARRPFGVVLLPAEFQVEDAVWQDGLAGLPEPTSYDRDEPQRSIARGLAELGIPCLDLLPLFRAAAPLDDGDRHLYRRRDTHFGVRGNDLAGRALAPFVRKLLR